MTDRYEMRDGGWCWLLGYFAHWGFEVEGARVKPLLLGLAI